MLYNNIEEAPQTLPKLYLLAREQVYKGIKIRKKVLKLPDSERIRISKNIPQCISYILREMPKKSAQVNFNKLVMNLVLFFQMVDWDKRKVWAMIEPFVKGYAHSETYDTPEKRIKHWKSQWQFLKKQPDYTFNCSFVKALFLSKRPFDCSKCIGKKKTLASFSSGEVLEALRQNEDGDAKLFIRINKNILCYDHAESRWYNRKEGDHWTEDLVNQVTSSLKKVVKIYAVEAKRQSTRRINAAMNERSNEAAKAAKIYTELIKRMKLLQTRKRKTDVLYLAAAGEGTLGITGLEWDDNSWLLGCKNGILDLRTGELRPVDPEEYIKTVAPTKWKGMDTSCPLWEKFLSDIFNNNELIGFTQRVFGYSMIGEASEDIFPIFWGEEGRNGKDTLFETLKYVLGDYASPIESELLLAKRFNKRAGSPSPEILALRGKRIVWASETEEGRKFDVAKIKHYSGGGTLVARGLYAKRPITFLPSFTIFLITNSKPKAKGDDPAFWERVFLIPLTQRFVKRPNGPNEHKADIDMPKKLKKESPGILAWFVRGCLEWQNQGLNPPDIVLQATEEYKLEEDVLGRFIDDCCDKRSNNQVKAGQLYEAYAQWAEENTGETITKQTFFKKMLKRVDDSYRSNKGRFYLGIALKKTEG